MIHRLTLLFVLFSTVCYNQTLYFSYPFPVSDITTGNTHARVTLVNNDPFLVWGAPAVDDNLFYAHWNGNGFDSPTQLTYSDEMVMLGYAEGPVVRAKGDTVYIIYVSMGSAEHRVYMRRSFDGGQSFSDTMIVNDRAFGLSLEYANMEIDNNGNPSVSFIRNEIGDVPKYVFYRSNDAGTSWSTEINATPDTVTQPCECCPASMSLENNYVYLVYRNNNSNIRDFYVSISENGGLTFDSLKRIDFSNYFTSSCPASGSSTFNSSDSILSVYMTKIGGQAVIKGNSIHKTSFEVGPEYFIDPNCISGGYTMNYPEIAGSGDTIAVVWQDNRAGQVKCYISASTTGLSGLSAPQLISDFSGTHHYNPHVAYKNGFFHLTWRDFSGGNIWYRKASFDASILGIDESEVNPISIFPNPATDNISVIHSLQSAPLVNISDLSGKILFTGVINSGEKINTENFAPGVYLIEFNNGSKNYSRKLIIQQ